ncbi:MAG: magnesium protoporphyrin IX methyltransferase [Marivibrio sp.]|uniref:magnesium protoporphyrin IX methyltransferase n=1 Tax=Marivibrio sp. TaxID=2039719 RepID=UPI0032EEDADC
MDTASYTARRGQIAEYFDRTAADAWAKLTSDAPVSKIRATVRAGRDRMRATLLSYLPDDLSGKRLLDAGCGTGALAVEAARRGAEVVAIDLSPTLVDLARERTPVDGLKGSIRFTSGDMLSPDLGRFDHVVAMDSLIHYDTPDMVRALAGLADRTETSIVFTFAPKTPALAAMHAVGRLFPRGDRAPAIEPVGRGRLAKRIDRHAGLVDWRVGRGEKITSGFYMSHAQELVRS